MPILDWIGKDAVINHHKEVPYRLLNCDSDLSVGKANGNLLIQGDNLEALKALLPLEDGGDRRFILVEMEENIVQDITAERLKRVINGYTWKDAKDKKQKEPGLGGGFRYCSLGATIFNPDGTINPAIKFKDLAQHIYFTETRNPWPGKAKGPLIGEFDGVSYYLFFNGVEGGNGFGRAELALLPKDHAPKVVYADKTRLGPAALAAWGLTFKHIPYEIKVE